MPDVVVVGAGSAGLAAAHTLEKAGLDCLVLEKNKYSGGRTRTAVKEGFLLDLGAQFFFTRFTFTFELMKSVGISDYLVDFKKPLGILRDGTTHILYHDIKDNLLHPLTASRFGAISNRGKASALKFGAQLLALAKKLDFREPEKAIELDDVSFAEYARKNFGDELLEYIFQPIASTLTLGNPEEISAAYGLALALYFLPGLRTTTKGMGFLTESLARNTSNLKLDTQVSRVIIENKRVRGVEVKSNSGTDFIEAPNVVLCTTATQAAKLLPGIPQGMRKILRDVRYSSCTHVIFALPAKVMGDIYAIATPRREGFSFSGFTEDANKHPAYAPTGTGLMHVFTFGNYAKEMLKKGNKRVKEEIVQELQTIIPQFPDEQIFAEVHRWKEAVCLSSPSHITSIQKLKAGLRDYGGLELAGDYLGMPSVEAAVYSGVKAARRTLKCS